MKNPVPPTQKEITLPEGKLLISKMNLEGVVTYTNTVFNEYSGFTAKELLGQAQESLRHPDMPHVIFEILWKTLKQHREFNGYIKKLTKTGDHYWVFATITTSYNYEHQLLGYNSVYRKPDPEKLEYIKTLYSELREIEKSSTADKAIDNSLFKLNTVLNARECGYDEFILSI